jgi:glycosyltransferase involved in cell wall biosynthesis
MTLQRPTRQKCILVYSIESTWSPCPQIRLIKPFSYLQDKWKLVWGIQDGKISMDAAAEADIIVLHRFTPGLMPIAILEEIFALGKPVVYESDDLLNNIPADHPEAADSARWKTGIEYAIRHAHAVVVSTPELAEQYRALNPHVHVLMNYLDIPLFQRQVPRKKKGDPLTIGLLGSSIQPSNFALVAQVLRQLQERYTNLTIHFVGWKCPEGWENTRNTQFFPFIHEYENCAQQLKTLAWDIALIPLADDTYNACKSYIKWLDYSAAGIVSVFSDVSSYNSVVTHEKTGLLLPPEPNAWLDAVVDLIEHPEKRTALAQAAQEEVMRDYSLKAKATHYDATYDAFLGAPSNSALSDTHGSDDRIPALLLLDPLGETDKIDATLIRLGSFLPPNIKIVILTTKQHNSQHLTQQAQQITATPAGYAAMLSKLQQHDAFKWLLSFDVNKIVAPTDIPGLASYQSVMMSLNIPKQVFSEPKAPTTLQGILNATPIGKKPSSIQNLLQSTPLKKKS